MDYKILTSDEVSDLEKQVKAAIADGWKPQGGVACSEYVCEGPDYDRSQGRTRTFGIYQAMVKEAVST